MSRVTCGLLFSITAVMLRSIKVVLQDKLLTPSAYSAETGEKQALVKPQIPVEPMHVWALQGLPCIAVSVVYALVTEETSSCVGSLTFGTASLILGTCISAAVLNILGMFIIKQLGGASMQIVGKLNTIMIVAFSVAFLRERLQGKVIVGTCLICCGVAVFEYAEKVERDGAMAS